MRFAQENLYLFPSCVTAHTVVSQHTHSCVTAHAQLCHSTPTIVSQHTQSCVTAHAQLCHSTPTVVSQHTHSCVTAHAQLSQHFRQSAQCESCPQVTQCVLPPDTDLWRYAWTPPEGRKAAQWSLYVPQA
jgi:hypothetical protein